MKIASVAAIVALAGAAQAQIPAAGETFAAFTLEGVFNLSSNFSQLPGSGLNLGFGGFGGSSDSFITFGGDPLPDSGNGAVNPPVLPSTVQTVGGNVGTATTTLDVGTTGIDLIGQTTTLTEQFNNGQIVSQDLSAFSALAGLDATFDGQALFLGQITQQGNGQTIDGTGLEVSIAALNTEMPPMAELADTLVVDLVDVTAATAGYQIVAVTNDSTIAGAAGGGPGTTSQLFLVGLTDGALADLPPVISNDPAETFAVATLISGTTFDIQYAVVVTDDDGIADDLLIEWDLDGDGEFDDATGAAGTATVVLPSLEPVEAFVRVTDNASGDTFTVSASAGFVPTPGFAGIAAVAGLAASRRRRG